MTRLQQVLFEVEGPYMGHPYFVTGNALYNALVRRVDAETRRSLHVSMGVFMPGEYGSYPDEHSQSGGVPYMGTGLRPVERYEDLFLFRSASQDWLSDSRPRDAHNTFDIQNHGGRPAFAPTNYFGMPSEHRNTKRSVTWHVHAYMHAGRNGSGVLPLSEDVLDGLRVGGARNYGFGELAFKDAQLVDLDALDMARLDAAADRGHGFVIELVSPYVLTSAHPHGDDQDVPWWWGDAVGVPNTENASLRRRETRLVSDDGAHTLNVVDHGQVVAYAGSEPVRTAVNGVLRTGTHSRFGFGEFRVRPANTDRVPERAEAARTRGDAD